MSESAAHPSTGARPGALRPDVEHHDKPPVLLSYRQLDDRAMALRKAWAIYLAMAVLPPLFMIFSIFYLIFTPLNWYDRQIIPLENTAGWYSFLLGMIWISVTVPLSFYMRRHYWSAYYHGELVEPGNYLKGNLSIWIPLVIAGILGFVAFALTRYVANLFTSVTAFVIFLTMFPNGHAMTRPIGDHDDPGVYELPR